MEDVIDVSILNKIILKKMHKIKNPDANIDIEGDEDILNLEGENVILHIQ